MNHRKIYRKIAKGNGVTVAQVKRKMQSALEYAYKNSNNTRIIKAYQGEVPTPDEFIRCAVEKLKKESQS